MYKIVIAAVLVTFLLVPLAAQNVGDPAPDFTHESLEHGTVSLSDHLGKVIFLFFIGHN